MKSVVHGGLAAAVALVMSSCGVGSSTWSEAEAQQEFLDAQEARSIATDEDDAESEADPSSDSYDSYDATASLNGRCEDVAASIYSYAQRLEEGKWPEDVQGPMDRLIAAELEDHARWTDCAEESDAFALLEILDEIGNADSAQEETAVRLALGLPAESEN